MRYFLFVICLLFTAYVHAAEQSQPATRYVILYIWDGLRADAPSDEDTPNLKQLMKNGVTFLDHHSTYPTLTMMNAASFATGDRAGKTGFYGNTLWHPGIQGLNSANRPVNFQKPVFTEDYKILQSLDQDILFFAPTLFNIAQKNNLVTATVGKIGPAFLQDYQSKGVILDEKHVSPLSFAILLKKEGYALPKESPLAFSPNQLVLRPNNGDPTAPSSKPVYFPDGVTSNPHEAKVSPFTVSNQYMMDVYLNVILKRYKPQLSVIWMRTPDSMEHTYGPGSDIYKNALRHNDRMLGQLIAALKKEGIYSQTDIIIGSDHAHSSVSGPLALFPLRQGLSASGAIRTADLLTKEGFHAYDGNGCQYNPIMSGIKADGQPLYQTKIDKTGNVCGNKNEKYTTPPYDVPSMSQLPHDAIVIAPNGGTDYFYVPSHQKILVEKLVRFLQSKEMYGAIFVDHTRYGDLAGTLPLSSIHVQGKKNRTPDVIVSFNYDTKSEINNFHGIEYSESSNERGMHGSFSPIDIHNFLAASGPDFRSGWVDSLPTGNVDVAPTIAYLLSLPFQSEGRVLTEALKNHQANHQVEQSKIISKYPAKNLKIYNVLDQPLKASQYTTVVFIKKLSDKENTYIYFDSAQGVRD